MPLRIGVNALYLIPGGVGGTEIYLRSLLAALSEIDRHNHYFVFTNRETGSGLVPAQANFTHVPQAVQAVNRPARILWEQTVLPLSAVRRRLDVLFNPGFTAPILCGCPQVTVFHDLQHKRHPEYFRWFDLPFWNFFLFWSITVSRCIVAVSGATADDLRRCYRLPPAKIRTVLSTRTKIWMACCAPSPSSPNGMPSTASSSAACTVFSRRSCTTSATVSSLAIAWNSRVGFRASSCTIFTRALTRSSTRACSRASDCPFWRPSPPPCPPVVPPSSP
jgi:hypothetical protein